MDNKQQNIVAPQAPQAIGNWRTTAEIDAEIARLEAERNALAKAEWTPQVGDEVMTLARGIITRTEDFGFITVTVVKGSYFKKAEALIRPQYPSRNTAETLALQEAEAFSEEWNAEFDDRFAEVCQKHLGKLANPHLAHDYDDAVDSLRRFAGEKRITAPEYPALCPADHIVDANKMVEGVDAEPVGYANFYQGMKEDYSTTIYMKKEDATSAANPHAKETAVPLYRHPACATKLESVDHVKAIAQWYDNGRREHLMCWPVQVGTRNYNVTVAPHDPSGFVTPPVAVAWHGVKKKLEAIIKFAEDSPCLDFKEDRTLSWLSIAAMEARTALAEIVTLPEPSEDAKTLVARFYNGESAEHKLDVAAALIAATESEAGK